jgi:hypothetical protein
MDQIDPPPDMGPDAEIPDGGDIVRCGSIYCSSATLCPCVDPAQSRCAC